MILAVSLQRQILGLICAANWNDELTIFSHKWMGLGLFPII
jgi:hypothetical protein